MHPARALLATTASACLVLSLTACSEAPQASPMPTGGVLPSATSELTRSVAPSHVSAKAEPSADASTSTRPTLVGGTRSPLAPPPLPEPAAKGDTSGAEAFAKYWFDVVNYSYRTGNTDTLALISDDECETCNSVLHTIKTQYGGGGSFQGGSIVPKSITAPAVGNDGVVVAAILYDQAPLVAIDSTSGEKSEAPSTFDVNVGMVMKFSDGHWTTFEIGNG